MRCGVVRKCVRLLEADMVAIYLCIRIVCVVKRRVKFCEWFYAREAFSRVGVKRDIILLYFLLCDW